MRILTRLPIAASVLVAVSLVGAAEGAGSPSATVKVAFVQGEQVVQVSRNGSTLRQAVTALLAGPTAAERRREVATAVPAGTLLRAVSGPAASPPSTSARSSQVGRAQRACPRGSRSSCSPRRPSRV